jgi:polyisoprenoid-binding protein YceI
MMLYKPLSALLFGAICFAAGALAAVDTPTSTWSFDAKENAVTFHGRAALISVDGETSKVEGTLVQVGEKVTGTLTVDLRPLRTDNELRDSHMHQKYLETSKYPTAKLELKNVAASAGESFCGLLTVKVDTQEVCGTYALADSGYLLATFKLSLAKIPSLGIPSWAGATMSDEVTVHVAAKVKRQ